jgi:hypothetical protein
MTFSPPAIAGGELSAAPPAISAVIKPDLEIGGDLAGGDHQTYRELPFDVPPGVDRVTVTFTYDKGEHTVIDLGLWDPAGFRGWSGGARDRFTLAASDATPGYLAGPILAGRWHLELGVPNIRADSHSHFSAQIYFDRGEARSASLAIAGPALRSGPGWYRGDLHMHDAASDGSCASQSDKRVPCPLYRSVEAARASGLDFIAITDHNTVSQFGTLRELQPAFDKILLIPATEITTFHGHANALGLAHWVDFRVGTKNVPDIRALAKSVHAAGAILSINHPALPSGEICMGCGWTWPDTDYREINAIEVVNGGLADGPYAGIDFWYARLNQGYRLTGIAGSDNHDPAKPAIGRPMTVVEAGELSIPAIMDGIRRGHVFINVGGMPDRLLEVTAQSGHQHVRMGDTLVPQGPVAILAHISAAKGATASLIVNGIAAREPRAIVSQDVRMSWSLDQRLACGWLSVNVASAAGHRLLIGNPIYISCGPANKRVSPKAHL